MSKIDQAEQSPQSRRNGPVSEEEWDLGLTILEELVRINGLQGQPMSTRAIAAAVGVSFQAVQNIEYRAFKKLRRLTSHLRPELEDLGVVQRLDRTPKSSKVRATRKRHDSTLLKSDSFEELSDAEKRVPLNAEQTASLWPLKLKVVLSKTTDTLTA